MSAARRFRKRPVDGDLVDAVHASQEHRACICTGDFLPDNCPVHGQEHRGEEADLRGLLAAVEPFTIDGGVGCGTEEVDALVETYERIVGGLDCDCDPEGNIAAACRANGCRSARVGQPPAGEVERLRERLLSDEAIENAQEGFNADCGGGGRHMGSSVDLPHPDRIVNAINAAIDTASEPDGEWRKLSGGNEHGPFPPPSDSQGDQERCGAELIAAERKRQVEAEGWTPEHDDQHDCRELVKAAVCYANHAGQDHWKAGEQPPGWPWSTHFWKPTGDPIRDLTKAGALIAAEIDRLTRKSCPDCNPAPTQVERYENALEELAAEFDQRTADHKKHSRGTRRALCEEAASLVREKAREVAAGDHASSATPESLTRHIHETWVRVAKQQGFEVDTTPWEKLPEMYRQLSYTVVRELVREGVVEAAKLKEGER